VSGVIYDPYLSSSPCPAAGVRPREPPCMHSKHVSLAISLAEAHKGKGKLNILGKSQTE